MWSGPARDDSFDDFVQGKVGLIEGEVFAQAVDLRKQGVGFGLREAAFEGAADGLGPGGEQGAERGQSGGLGADGVEQAPKREMLPDNGGRAADERGEVEDRSGLRKRSLDIREAPFKEGDEEGVFAGEMGVEESGGEAGLGGDGLYGGVGETIASE